jgi:hypothetical protein
LVIVFYHSLTQNEKNNEMKMQHTHPSFLLYFTHIPHNHMLTHITNSKIKNETHIKHLKNGHPENHELI